MSGKYVPVVLFPRYSTTVGTGVYPSFPIDVTAFERLSVTLWRGMLIGTTPGFGITFQESNDRDAWTACIPLAPPSGWDPGPMAELTVQVTLTKAWLRWVLALTGVEAGATMWGQGFFTRREQ